MIDLIGREYEIARFDKIMRRRRSSFIAVFGRRRVGKTFLIKEYFDYTFDFQLTGLANGNTEQQLLIFHIAMSRQFEGYKNEVPTNWIMAFQFLIDSIEDIHERRKKIIFIDEMPWFDTARSDFMMALEHFWNSWACGRKDVVLIASGSAATWMINELINSHGGLHNRVTDQMKIYPFTLRETELLLLKNGVKLDRYQVMQLYMVMGGIPFYLDAIQSGLSAAQNIELLCFSERGLLVNEFDHLFRSLFKKSKNHVAIVVALSKKTKGISRKAIVSATGISSGGTMTNLLDELEESGFISSYSPFQRKQRNTLYRLSDFYSSFYLRFIKNNKDFTKGKWTNAIDNPSQRAWAGFSFEQVCLAHIPQVKKALGISGVMTTVSSWSSTKTAGGAQVDLVIDRNDHVINLCEMKYSISPYMITKKYDENLRNKISVFRQETKTKKAIFLTMLTTYGLQINKYSGSIVQNDLKMDVLFD